MPYRRTKKYKASRQLSQVARDASRIARPAPDYPATLPELRMRIVVERFDSGECERHEFTLLRSRRVDQYRVFVDGEAWRVAGLSAVLEGLRKAHPRMLSARSLA